jgi:hypothetical protein
MKFNFRKIASVLTSAVMLTSTVGLAAAANYPAPYVEGGAADVAVVYGSTASLTDAAAVIDITNHLSAKLVEQTGGSTTPTTSIDGEAAPLFTGGTKIYVNDTLNYVKSTLTKTDLPTILAEGTFSGNVDAKSTLSLVLGANPQITFQEQPTSSDDPAYGLTISRTPQTYPVYTAKVDFNKAVNLTHADSIGATITMFGQEYTVSASTDATNLILLQSAEKISLTTDNPTATVTIAGKEYEITLFSASDTTATISVKDSEGNTDQKEVTENKSKKINGLTIAVTTADETNLQLSASVLVGAEKITLSTGSAVLQGEDDNVIDGTRVGLVGGIQALTQIQVNVSAEDSSSDAVMPGETFLDPVFKTFKLDFPGLSISSTDTTSRETISLLNSGDNKMEITFTDHAGNTKTLQYAIDLTTGIQLQHNEDGSNITVLEKQKLYEDDMAVIGNEEEGTLIKVLSITNATTGHSNDKVTLQNVMNSELTDVTITSEGVGTVTLNGKSYDVVYNGTSGSEDLYITLDFPDSSSTATAIAYPSIQTSKGAKLMFYEPLTVNLSDWDYAGTDLTTIRIPDGEGYTDTAIVLTGNGNFTVGGTPLNYTDGAAKTVTIGQLSYNFTATGYETLTIYANLPDGGTTNTSSIILLEERDDNSQYHGIVVTTEPGRTSADGIGIDDVSRSWGGDAIWDSSINSLSSDSDISQEADLYGTIVTIDADKSDQKTLEISYPEEQIYALLYIAEEKANIVKNEPNSGSSSGVKTLGSVSYTDNELPASINKNLVVVGGSCVNSYAATLIGKSFPTCGANWESATGVGSGSYLIQTFSQSNGKIATLVAGYNAGDTTNAAKYLTTQTVETTAGKKYVGTSATSASLVTTAPADE